MIATPKGYSGLQIALHWTVVVLVALQMFVLNDSIGQLRDGEAVGSTGELFADLHVAAGIAVFVLALARLYLRFTRGVPMLPPDEPYPMKLAAHAVHAALYALILLMPITGALAWWLDLELMADIHGLGENAIMVVVALHIVGALYQHFIARTDVLRRMLRADR